jgi:hypothetical protein
VINDEDLTPTDRDMEKVKSHMIKHRNQLDQSNEVEISQQIPSRISGAIREGEERGSLAH